MYNLHFRFSEGVLSDWLLRRSPLGLASGFWLARLHIVLMMAGGLLLISCGNGDVKPKKEIDPSQFKEQLVKVNKYEAEKERDEINQYIARHQWAMEKTGTGLRYMFLANGNGTQPQSGDFVKVNYKISLLDGTKCYSSDKDGAKEFKVEGEDIESGLHEAVLLMHIGDKAKFILPSYMAHGLHGDDANIPPLSTIVVDLELLQVK